MDRFLLSVLVVAVVVVYSQAGEDTLFHKCHHECATIGEYLQQQGSCECAWDQLDNECSFQEWMMCFLEEKGLAAPDWDCQHLMKVGMVFGQTVHEMKKDAEKKKDLEKWAERVREEMEAMAGECWMTLLEEATEDCKEKAHHIWNQIM